MQDSDSDWADFPDVDMMTPTKKANPASSPQSTEKLEMSCPDAVMDAAYPGATPVASPPLASPAASPGGFVVPVPYDMDRLFASALGVAPVVSRNLKAARKRPAACIETKDVPRRLKGKQPFPKKAPQENVFDPKIQQS